MSLPVDNSGCSQLLYAKIIIGVNPYRNGDNFSIGGV